MKEGLLAILKFFFFLLILPLIVAVSQVAYNSIAALPAGKEHAVVWGGAIFILMFLFVYAFEEVYVFGQTLVGNMLKFTGPIVEPAKLIIPLYVLLIVCVFLILRFAKVGLNYEHYVLMALGFTVAMHIVLTAHQLYKADTSPIKAQYFFAFGIAYIVSVILLALCVSAIIQEFSFMNFFKAFSHLSTVYYTKIYDLLLVSPP